jgi:hypothetical protein
MKRKYQILSFALILLMTAYFSELSLSSETSWETTHYEQGTCSLNGTSKGVGIHMLAAPPLLYKLTIEKPSKLNDWIQESIKWPNRTHFEATPEEEQDIFAAFNFDGVTKLKLKLTLGYTGGDISSYDEKEFYDLLSSLLSSNYVEIYKRSFELQGMAVNRLGGWTITKADKVKIEDFYKCIRQA